MSNVCDFAYRYSIAISSSSDPANEMKKNFTAAYTRCSRPHVPISRYSGISVASKKMKNSSPSCATKTPIISPERIWNDA